MSPLERELSTILWELWDPIRVRSMGAPPDEYDSYIPGVIRTFQRDPSSTRLHAHLEQLERVNMGLQPLSREQREPAVAALLKALARVER